MKLQLQTPEQQAARAKLGMTVIARVAAYPDREFTGTRLFEEVKALASEPGALENTAERARTFARPGAAERAAEILEQSGF